MKPTTATEGATAQADERRRLLLLTTSLRTGGTERVVCHLARGLAPRYRVSVACLEPEGPLAEPLRQAGIPVHAYGARRSAAAPRVTLALAGTLVRERVDVLQTFLFHANVVGRAAARLARARGWRGLVVSSLRTAETRPAWRRHLERWTAGAAGAVVCVSDAVRAHAIDEIGLLPELCTVIPNGVEIEDERAHPEAPAQPWISVTRLAADKRPAELVAAWRAMGARGEAPRLLLVGDGPLRPEVARAAASLPIELLGERHDVRALLRRAAGFAFAASPAEGCPNAILEAMAEGLPVVSTRAGGIAQLVRHEQTGLLVPPNDPEALARAVKRLDAAPAERARLGAAGRAIARAEHGLQSMLARYDALYQRLTSGPGALPRPPG